jgi:hypothetical protein
MPKRKQPKTCMYRGRQTTYDLWEFTFDRSRAGHWARKGWTVERSKTVDDPYVECFRSMSVKDPNK